MFNKTQKMTESQMRMLERKVEELERLENISEDQIDKFEKIINNLFKTYSAKSSFKREITNRIDSLRIGLELEMDEFERTFVVGNNILEKSIKLPKIDLDKIKNKLKKMTKKQVIAVGMATVVVSSVASAATASHLSKENKTKQIEETKDNNNFDYINRSDMLFQQAQIISQEEKTQENVEEKEKTLSSSLNFDPEDKEVQIDNLYSFFEENLKNGIELKDEVLENQLEKWINAYTALNINEVGPMYLANLYQNDKVMWRQVDSDCFAVIKEIVDTNEALALDKGEVMDLSKLFANKEDLKLVTEYNNLQLEMSKAFNSKDEAKMKEVAAKGHELIFDTLLDAEVNSYGPYAKIYSIYVIDSINGILVDYKDVKETLDNDLEEDTLRYAVRDCDLLTDEQYEEYLEKNRATSKLTAFMLEAINTLSAKYENRDQLIYQGLDFTNEISIEDMKNTLAKSLRDNKILDTYVESKDLEILLYGTKLEGTGGTLEKGDVNLGNGTYIDANTLNGRSQAQYETDVKNSYNSTTTVTDINTGETVGNSDQDAEDYSKGYSAGSAAGAAAGSAGKSKAYGLSGSESSSYQKGYKKGYDESYAQAIAVYNQSKNQSTTTTEDVKDQVVEQTTDDNSKQDNSNKKDNKSDNNSKKENTSDSKSDNSSKKENTSDNSNSTTTYEDVDDQVVEEVVIEEEIIEETTPETNSNEVTSNSEQTIVQEVIVEEETIEQNAPETNEQTEINSNEEVSISDQIAALTQLKEEILSAKASYEEDYSYTKTI